MRKIIIIGLLLVALFGMVSLVFSWCFSSPFGCTTPTRMAVRQWRRVVIESWYSGRKMGAKDRGDCHVLWVRNDDVVALEKGEEIVAYVGANRLTLFVWTPSYIASPTLNTVGG